jgi:hypothetical protein
VSVERAWLEIGPPLDDMVPVTLWLEGISRQRLSSVQEEEEDFGSKDGSSVETLAPGDSVSMTGTC